MHGVRLSVCHCKIPLSDCFFFVCFIQTLILKSPVLILKCQSTSKKHMYCFTGELRQIKEHSVSVKNSGHKANHGKSRCTTHNTTLVSSIQAYKATACSERCEPPAVTGT